jgi:hypothetical protein
MTCQERHPPPPPPSCLSEKNRDPVPSPAAAALPGIRASCRSPPVRLRPSRSRPSGLAASPNAVRAAATADRGPDGCRGSLPSLVERVAAGEGTASRFFQRARWWRDGAELRSGTASTGSRSVEAGLGWKAGASDPRTEHPPVRCGTAGPETAQESGAGMHGPARPRPSRAHGRARAGGRPDSSVAPRALVHVQVPGGPLPPKSVFKKLSPRLTS